VITAPQVHVIQTRSSSMPASSSPQLLVLENEGFEGGTERGGHLGAHQ